MIGAANRGAALEQLIDLANARYYARNLAVITKQHSKWLPIRSNGKIISAKIDQKSSVDYRGSVKNRGAVAFDAKETSTDKWYLSRLEPHQCEFLEKCALMGDFSFILIYFRQYDLCFILPIENYKTLKQSNIKSVTPETLSIYGYQVDSADYLGLLERRKTISKTNTSSVSTVVAKSKATTGKT